MSAQGESSAFVMTTDAFGGHGGIAKYNRDFLRSLCSYERMQRVVALPRIAPNSLEVLPSNLDYGLEGLGGIRPFAMASVRRLTRERGFDLVVCGHINLLPIAALAKARYRRPLMLLIYGIDAWRPPSTRARILAPLADVVVSISETTLGRFLKWSKTPRAHTHVLPNAFEPSAFGAGPKPTALLARYPKLADKRVVMTFGRMAREERYKGFDEILELMPELLREHADIAYLVVGDGNDRPRLEAKSRELGVAEHVVFTGRIAEEEKADHYRLADAYVMPGRGEGFGFVLLEAMACGIPVVASSLDGSREAVRGGELGLVVDPRDPRAIKEAVLEALARPRGIVPPGLDYFSFANFERRTHDILDVVLAARSRRTNQAVA